MKIRNELPAILLVVAMFAVAEHIGQKEIIFPEIAALTGILIVRYFTYAPFFMITAAFCLVVLQLKLARSAVLPSISAAILPIITHSDSWHYPMSVCLLTGILAVGRVMNPNDSGKMSMPANTAVSGHTTLSALDRRGSVHWIKLLAGVSLVTAVAVCFDLLFMVAHPLSSRSWKCRNRTEPRAKRPGEPCFCSCSRPFPACYGFT
jgi:hypothetical protein